MVAHFTENADKVHRISIIPRSKGALGFIQQVPEEERHLMTQEDLLGRIRVLLGGRAAEKVLIGKVTTGAYDDLKRASDMARRMITEFGMGDSLGLVSLSERNEQYQNNPFIQSGTADVSNETAQKIDVEIRKILDREFQNACQIIQEKTSVIHKMITRLLEKETIEGKEITELFGAGARKGAQGTKTKDDPNSSAIISGIDNERSF